MPNSLKAKFKKLLYEKRISSDEYISLIDKLDNHDKVVYNQALDDFMNCAFDMVRDEANAKFDWLNELHIGFTTKQLKKGENDE